MDYGTEHLSFQRAASRGRLRSVERIDELHAIYPVGPDKGRASDV